MGLLGIIFGFLAALSLWAAWRDSEWRSVAGALVVSYVASNLTVHFVDIAAKPAIFTSTEIVIALMAFMAAHGKYHWSASVLLVLTFASVFCNLTLAFTYRITWSDIHAHEIRTNLIYVAECLLTIATGIRQRGYFDRRTGDHIHADTTDALAKEANDQ